MSHYFAIGTTLAGMVNLSTYVTIPPNILDDGEAPLLGGAATRAQDATLYRDGWIRHNWRLDLESRADYNALIYGVFGGFTTASKTVYITTISEDGYYSPFLCKVDKPYPSENYRVTLGGWVRDLTMPFVKLQLQSVTKTTTATLTASERLAYCDTSGGNFTVTLPAADAVGTNTVVSVRKTSASNTLTIAAGAGDTVSDTTLTANNGRYDFASDGVSAWASVTA